MNIIAIDMPSFSSIFNLIYLLCVTYDMINFFDKILRKLYGKTEKIFSITISLFYGYLLMYIIFAMIASIVFFFPNTIYMLSTIYYTYIGCVKFVSFVYTSYVIGGEIMKNDM